MNEQLKEIKKQNQQIIELLGRIAFPEAKLRKIITTRKRDPQAYINGYNACDGTKPVMELAKIIGVSHGTLSPILKEWENQGIIYEVEGVGGRFYKHLYSLP